MKIEDIKFIPGMMLALEIMRQFDQPVMAKQLIAEVWSFSEFEQFCKLSEEPAFISIYEWLA